MVSRKHTLITMRNALWVAAIAVAGALGQQATAAENGRKFYPDDPLLREPAPRPVSGVATRSVDHIYDFLESSYVTPRREGKIAKHAPQPALDVNTLGEVPTAPGTQTGMHSTGCRSPTSSADRATPRRPIPTAPGASRRPRATA